MNMNFNQIAMIQKLKGCMDRFRMNHPKFPLFLNAVSQDALIEGAVVEITDIIQALRHALRRYHSGSSGRSMVSSLPCRHPARDRQVDGRNRFLLRVG